MKICRKCNIEQDELKFEKYYTKKCPNNRRLVCKKCRNEQRKKFDCRNGDGLRERMLKRNYGMTIEDYINISQMQDNKCLICKLENKFGPWPNKLVVDHDHKTGKIRGLLCDKCNKGLGQFNDNCELLLNAIKYLTKE